MIHELNNLFREALNKIKTIFKKSKNPADTTESEEFLSWPLVAFKGIGSQ